MEKILIENFFFPKIENISNNNDINLKEFTKTKNENHLININTKKEENEVTSKELLERGRC